MLISVIMPAYNAEQWIEDAVRHVIDQTYQDWELIIINDGSTDSTPEICARLQNEDSRIKVLTQENKGPCRTRNIGMSCINGDYFIIIDSDDKLKKNALFTMGHTADGTGADIVISSYVVHKQIKSGIRSEEVRKIKKDYVFSPNGNLNSNEISTLIEEVLISPTWNKLFHKKFAGYLFDIDLSLHEDTLFSLNAIANAKKVAVISDVLYEYIIRNNSLSQKFHPEAMISLERMSDIFQAHCDGKLNKGIAAWIIDFWFMQTKKIANNKSLDNKQKKKYLNEAVHSDVFRKYGKIRYANTTKRKISVIMLQLGMQKAYLRIIERKK